MKGSVKLPVFIDDARKYVNTTQLRAKYLGASYEAEYCQWQTLHGLGSLMETASLIITPNAYLEGKLIASYPPDPIGDFDVTRATTATRVNSAGLVELVPYNLLSYSQDIVNADWQLYQLSVTANNTTAPDGTTTADKITQTGSGAGTFYKFPYTYSSGRYTASCYFKKGTANVALIEGNPTSSNFSIAYNLDTEVITPNGTGYVSTNIENLGNGWYRCSVVVNINASTGYIAFGLLGSSGNTMFAWGAQLVEGSTAKDYQKTETRLNIPRLDYSNGTCPSLLVEPQRTNRIVYSSSFDNGAWSAIDTTISANTTISPEGIQNADTMAISSSTSRIFQYTGLGAGTYTASVYVKALSGTPTIQFRMVVDGADITDSIPTTTEWVRHDFTFTASTSMDYFVLRGESGTGSVAIWGAQLEAGSYATSYIPTTSASVTRNADVISKSGISSLIGQTEGTIFVDAYITGKDSTNGSILFTTDKTSTSAFIRIVYTQLDSLRFDVFDGSSFQCILSAGPYNVGDRVKVAGGYKNNDFVMYVNGTQIGTDTSGSVPATDTANINTHIFGDTNGSFVNSAALWKERKDNAFLAQLTTI